MAATDKPVWSSFAAAMKDYFGFAPDQNLGAFAAEVKALSDKDKSEYKAMLEGVGYKFAA